MVQIRKKTLLLDQELLDSVRRQVGARTETETVTRALEEMRQKRRFIEFLDTLAHLGPFHASRI